MLRRILRARRAPALKARYDAAQTTPDNRRHWAGADGLSANSANSPAVRSLLRNRARYEFLNNSYCRGMVAMKARHVIGTGPRLQLRTESDRLNRFVEREFRAWRDAVDLTGKLRVARMALSYAGEEFIVMAQNPKLADPGSRVTLDVKCYEADQVTDPYPSNDARNIDGVIVDEFGNPTSYQLLKDHPGANRPGSDPGEFDVIPARFMIHYRKQDRSGQTRGVPELTPALPLFSQLRRFTLATIAAAETAADFAAVIYNDVLPGDESEQPMPMEEIELERRMATVLPGGWKLGQIDSKHPNTVYSDFVRAILVEISRCLELPYNVAVGDSSGHNYASGRLDGQGFIRVVSDDRGDIERLILDRLLAAWIDEAVLLEDYLPQEGRLAGLAWDHQWFWDGQPHVDPVKEATAQAKRLESKTTTLAAEYAKEGKDWEHEVEQIAKERRKMIELGIEPESTARSNRASAKIRETIEHAV